MKEDLEKFLLVFHRKETINICSRKISYFWWWQLFVDVELIVEERSDGGEGSSGEQHRCRMKSNPTMKRLNSLTSHIRLLLMTAHLQLLLLYKSRSEECCSRWRWTPSWRTRCIMRTGTPSSSIPQDGCSDLLGGCCKGQDGYLWTRSLL